jgi:hypothetical protein
MTHEDDVRRAKLEVIAWLEECSASAFKVDDPESAMTTTERKLMRRVATLIRDVRAESDAAHADCCVDRQTLQHAEAKVARLRGTLVKAALPLEAIYSSVEWELTSEIMASVATAVDAIRAALAARPEAQP